MYDNAEPPPQRRDNGLRADAFVALADVDPRLGEHLLDLLRLADIAAYLEPPGDPRVATRYRVAGPVERLFVQSDLRRAAREVVLAAAREAGAPTDATAPGDAGSPDSAAAQQRSGSAQSNGPDLLKGLDTDAEFARIMAGYDVAAPPRSSVRSGQGGIAQDGIAEDGIATDGIAQGDPAGNDASHALGNQNDVNHDNAAHDVDDHEEDDHFVPPAAPPFPIPRGETVGALVLFLFGLLVIARGDWLGLGSNASFPIGVVLVLTAIVLLIKGLHDSEPDDVDPDDGAIV